MNEQIDARQLPDPTDANAIVRAFAANPAFRAAEWDELTTENNPYRRPVRPADLEWLDYSKPIAESDYLKLSGLLGHRMLRNVYDCDLLYLPPVDDKAAAIEQPRFYSDRNRILSAMAGPVLENHLFALLDNGREPVEYAGPEWLRQRVRDYYERRLAEPGRVFEVAAATRDRRAAATFTLLQFSAFTPAQYVAVSHGANGEYQAVHPALREMLVDEYRGWVRRGEQYRGLLDAAGLRPGAGAYWQLYLTSSLARGNHLHYLSRRRERCFDFLGAVAHRRINEELTRDRFRWLFTDGFGGGTDYFDTGRGTEPTDPDRLVDALIQPLYEAFGPRAIEGFAAGFSDAAWFADLWDEDLSTQLAWADRIDEHQRKAEQIDRYLTDEHIEVDLDTFVESHEETSTTHVHDEHRLVMIEVGEMHFWNNVTHKIQLTAGDKLLIPMSRLHGSTVLSGECTYHQPIIPQQLFEKF
ncbi:hypothetical protein [Nocardia sp. CDC160]|uniref:hypothetical protein n=1 Tax=Nocardia sp. CDC160 TaxID=3112166 RepID=UPI002DBAE1E9|nr:hypothetical protein [Nocardia sp. CDC160]MEC3918401.1 hypothetical protein [Nocardia sp. CDC160]MEC3919138.1 hypothetical protein [Nocardia sp. CDC160]